MIPRVIFSDPKIAAVGLTEQQAREEGIDVVTSRVSLPDAIARPCTYETEPRGELGLVADRERGVLVGAWAVAPLAGEWIHQAALAMIYAIPFAAPIEAIRGVVDGLPITGFLRQSGGRRGSAHSRTRRCPTSS